MNLEVTLSPAERQAIAREVVRLMRLEAEADRPAHMTVSEVREKTGYSDRTIRRYLAIGKLESVQAGGKGGKLLITSASVDRLLEGGS